MSDFPNKKDRLRTPDTISIHSDEINEILGFVPHWIVRVGILVIFLTVITLLVGSYFYKYPDIVTAKIEIISEVPPSIVKAKTTGKIMYLLIKDGQRVIKNQYLVVLENTADYNHVILLTNQLNLLRDSIDKFNSDELEVLCNQVYSLGELQSDYENFLKGFQDYQLFLKIKYHEKKIKGITDIIRLSHAKKRQLQNQVLILNREHVLAMKEQEREKALLDKGLISVRDYEQSSNQILHMEYSLESAKLQITNENIQLLNQEQLRLDLEMDYFEKKSINQNNISRACNEFYSRILIWEQNYILKAPSDGIVSLSKYWSNDQNVGVGDNVVTIIPENVNTIIGRISLPAQGSGKVTVGQVVNIKLSNYPHMEFGIVTGIVSSKSLIAEDDLYILTVDFPDGLITNYGINLPYSQSFKGTAEIITKDIRLIERIINPPKSLIKKNVI
ncbi:MAG: HlyD family efflux transporter periplasmic adaptor subunit [Candidatus Zixiibacteriota bacterium]